MTNPYLRNVKKELSSVGQRKDAQATRAAPTALIDGLVNKICNPPPSSYLELEDRCKTVSDSLELSSFGYEVVTDGDLSKRQKSVFSILIHTIKSLQDRIVLLEHSSKSSLKPVKKGRLVKNKENVIVLQTSIYAFDPSKLTSETFVSQTRTFRPANLVIALKLHDYKRNDFLGMAPDKEISIVVKNFLKQICVESVPLLHHFPMDALDFITKNLLSCIIMKNGTMQPEDVIRWEMTIKSIISESLGYGRRKKPRWTPLAMADYEYAFTRSEIALPSGYDTCLVPSSHAQVTTPHEQVPTSQQVSSSREQLIVDPNSNFGIPSENIDYVSAMVVSERTTEELEEFVTYSPYTNL